MRNKNLIRIILAFYSRLDQSIAALGGLNQFIVIELLSLVFEVASILRKYLQDLRTPFRN